MFHLQANVFTNSLFLKVRVHWRRFLVKTLATVTCDSTYLGHLGQYDTDRIISNYAAPPKVAKESKEGAIHIDLWCDIARDIASIMALNFANVNIALIDESW
jgi:hypothetical protein